MALYKLCPKCGVKIEYNLKYCYSCTKLVDEDKKNRYKEYRFKRLDTKEQEFYNSKEWRSKRNYILNKYKYIDVYAFYIRGVIIPSDLIHHIIPVKEDWDRRLDDNNLFPCSNESHLEIHSLYKTKDKNEVIKELNKMLDKFRKEYSIDFGY